MTSKHNQNALPKDSMDVVIRAQLDAEASRVDADGLWSGVLARLNADTVTPRISSNPERKSYGRGVRVSLCAMLALIMMISWFVLTPSSAVATPQDIIQKASQQLALSGDSCYHLIIEAPRLTKDLFPSLPDGFLNKQVWTRGKCFVVEPGLAGKGAWGRDALGRVWAAPSREAAARFEESELPSPLRNLVKVIGLELKPLLEEVLIDFDLNWSEPREIDRYTILATRRGKPGPFGVTSVKVVINQKDNTIISLVATRTLPDGQLANLYLNLASEKAQQDGDYYSAEGHLEVGAPIYDRARPALRGKIMMQHLGGILSREP